MIRKANTNDLGKVKELFVEYQEWLNVDLCFQGFNDELSSLPGAYSEPEGSIFLAELGNELVGCVAIRPLSNEIAEIKRFYVREAYRGNGMGKALLEGVLKMAKNSKYRKVVLDTLPKMSAAKSLYEKYDFEKIEPYYNNPLRGVEYFQKILD